MQGVTLQLRPLPTKRKTVRRMAVRRRRYRGRRRGGLFTKLIRIAVNTRKKVGQKVLQTVGRHMNKTAVTGMIKKAGKAVVDKVTDPKTLQKLAQEGADAGTKLVLGGKGNKKKLDQYVSQ